jgi:ligand-binding SRPBCC domain-containing protein
MTTLELISRVPTDQKSLFEFHTDFRNVQIVTPPFISLRFLSLPDRMEEGSRMTVEIWQVYRWMPWDVCVEVFVPHSLMVDVQSGRGPFNSWRHEHHCLERSDGVYLMDRIQYQLPFGSLGRFVDLIIVRSIQRLLFLYRHKKTIEYFSRS